ncbi:MAG TPA: cytochrome c [Alphaproteobacteria bacterium]|nr:cytochrome c [Alphaproteobacteria bacterium]
MPPPHRTSLSILTLGVAGLALAGCVEEQNRRDLRVVDGNPELGQVAVAAYDCGVCHVIPGVRSARGTVGPSLEGFGRRAYIAGFIPNRPGNLTTWIEDPPSLAPNTAMPDVGVTAEEAKHIAAYLYMLR